MKFKNHRKSSIIKSSAFSAFSEHVSSGKASFFQKYDVDFVMGRREGPYLLDIDGEKRLFYLHCNGGVFNLGHRNKWIYRRYWKMQNTKARISV